ncbi:hypothetical protein CR513_36444, partial [Mucuna pruriens]
MVSVSSQINSFEGNHRDSPDCVNLNLALWVEEPISTLDNLQEVKIEKWERSNRMCLMIMKRSILEAFWGSIFESLSASRFLEEIE